MAYDNFENTPFDLDNDGHIDSNEAAYIYETFYNEDNNPEDEDVSFGGSSYRNDRDANRVNSQNQALENVRNGKLPSGKTMEELERDVHRGSIRKTCIYMAIVMLAGEFIGGHLLTGIIVAAIFLVVGFSIK